MLYFAFKMFKYTLRNYICCALLQNYALLNSKTKLWSLSQSECIKKPPTPTHVDQTIRMKIYLTLTKKYPNIIETQRVGASTVKQHYTAVRFLLLATTGKKIKMCWRLDWIQRRSDLIQTTWNQTQCLSKYMQTCSLRGLLNKKKLSVSRRWWNLSIPVVLSHCCMDSHFPFWGQTRVPASSLP